MIDLLLDGVRSIFALLDTMVVFIIKSLYELIVAIADTNVFGDLIYHYLSRIYTFLGIFMVFKLSISMINYIINPDALTDKGKGFGKLISNVIISLILLVTTPTLFDVAFDIQEDLLTSNAVYQIVTGPKVESHDTLYESSKETGELIAYNVFRAFVYHEEGNNIELPKCVDGVEGCESGKCKENNIDCLLHTKTVTTNGNAYWFLLSTAVGLVVAYVLLTMCFDIALRSVKLGFLQIIAPIPIMLRMDPGAKDDKFSKWLKEVSSTFLSLFIKLAGLFFATEIIRLVMGGGEAYGMFETYSGREISGLTEIFTKLFIIIGCLMFAKKLPQLLSDLLGVKLDGEGFSLKKKVAGAAGLGAALGVAGLGAKKAVAGFDSMAHGKGFWNGTKNVQGNGWISKMKKGWDDMTPNRAQQAKQRREGNEKYREFEKSKNRGSEINSRLESLKSTMSSEDANIAVFGEQYGGSMNAVKAAKIAKLEAAQNLETAQQDLQAALNAKASGHSGTYNGFSNVDMFISAKRNEINNPSGLAKAVQDAQDRVDTLTEAHKSLQGSDPKHAQMEADLKTFKSI